MMSALKLSEINERLRAQNLATELTADAEAQRVCTDSRQVQAGDLFVALSGENFNADEFVVEVATKQASAAVVSQKQSVKIPQLVVSDTRLALGHIAAQQREQFTAPVIALTGSAGKTSTKEMLASILAEQGEVLATKGNLNNEIGVPLTLLQLAPQHRYAVIEMGAAKSADIAYLCQFAKPNIALVTNALQAHLAGFGSRDNIAKTKGEIYLGLGVNGTAVINIDSEYAVLWQQQAGKAKQLTFSLVDHSADIYAENIVEHGRATDFVLCAHGKKQTVQLNLLGRHNVANALAAAAAATAAGASLEAIKDGLEKVAAVAGRLNIIRVNKKLTIIDDTYNANPDAVKVAIDVLAQTDGQTCLVLGDMGELGENELALHHDVGVYCRQQAVSHLIAIGSLSQQAAEGFGADALWFETVEQFQAAGLPLCDKGTVLVKGSRSSRMERVVEIITTTNSNERAH